MRVGVPIWNGHVSPLLDVAKRLVLATVDADEVAARTEQDWSPADLATRARLLADLGVEVVLCGAVSDALQKRLRMCGIRVEPHLCGPVERVLEAFARDDFAEDLIMPGCHCGHGLRRRRKRRRRQQGAPNPRAQRRADHV